MNTVQLPDALNTALVFSAMTAMDIDAARATAKAADEKTMRADPLPALHGLIKHDLPEPNPSIAHGFAEMWPALRRQLAFEDYFIQRALPATARPYRTDFHAQ